MGRRGFYLENELDRVLKFLSNRGIHGHKNHARQTVDGAYIEGEPFDYEVISNGILHCFDAKECHGNRWSLKNAKLSQVQNLIQCANHGAEAYFLVYFVLSGKLKRFDAQFVKLALSSGKKSLIAEEGEDWDWQELTESRALKKKSP
ncbi:MAG: Holliday junction resolvase RecU [Bacteroidales bacterium]|nr:Holliday junction resolvase RecU [Bacteroidales bacterium]